METGMPTGRQPATHRLPAHHPGDELLAAYASGGLPESVELVIATHLAMCPACRAAVDTFETIGGVLLEALPDSPPASGSLEAVLGRLDENPREDPRDSGAAPVPSPALAEGWLFPRPLRDYLPRVPMLSRPAGQGMPGDIAALNWRMVMRGVEEVEIPTEADSLRPKLMRVRAGRALPIHTHRGEELILVLAGGFSDGAGHFLRGDLSHADQEIEHRPVADPGEDCLCLTVSTDRLRLTGPVGRFFNFLVKD